MATTLGRRGLVSLGLTLLCVSGCREREPGAPPQQAAVLPSPRTLTAAEQADLTKSVERFRTPLPRGAQLAAAGSFRMVDAGTFQYLDRTDIGSVVFEREDYGAPKTAYNFDAVPRDKLLARIDSALHAVGLDPEGRRFVTFLDEFAGAAPRPGGKQAAPLDLRKLSKLVGRTAEFERQMSDVPVFGSELLVGLMPDGSIGRLRLHWPKLEPALVDQARRLQQAVQTRSWSTPKYLEGGGYSILDVAAGVGHSGIADPGLRSAAVVRVLYRRTSGDSLALSSTGYKFFDAKGQEIQLNVFPSLPGTTLQNKPAARAP